MATDALPLPIDIARPMPMVADSCFRWPAGIAKDMADSIHGHVLNTLSQSRLVRNVERIALVRKEDIISLDEVLGSGAFSQVTAVTTRNGRKYACKHLKQTLMAQPESFRLAASELAYEAHMLASFDHPNILKIRGWAYNGIASFEEGWHDSFFLLLDKLEETLDQRIERWLAEEHNVTCNALLTQSPVMGQNLCGLGSSVSSAVGPVEQQHLLDLRSQKMYLEKLCILSGIASALEYIHERGVIFRDLKPNNIGFLEGRVQLFDFGLSRELPTLDTSVSFEMSGKVGTLRYMAPEVALGQPYNLSADVYSLAMVAYEMLSLQKPFEGWTRDMHTAFVCTQGLRPDTTNCLLGIPFDMRVLLEQSWHTNAGVRPTIHGVMAQLRMLEEQQLMVLKETQIQAEVSRHLELQRQAQARQEVVELAATAVAASAAAASFAQQVDAAYYQANCAPPKQLQRRESYSTAETTLMSYLSDESYDI